MELQLAFAGATGRQALHLPFGPADASMPAANGDELARICASWDEAWWIACGLIDVLAPKHVQLSTIAAEN
jgi:hypothetical protein